jgi:hypothetical protein
MTFVTGWLRLRRRRFCLSRRLIEEFGRGAAGAQSAISASQQAKRV